MRICGPTCDSPLRFEVGCIGRPTQDRSAIESRGRSLEMVAATVRATFAGSKSIFNRRSLDLLSIFSRSFAERRNKGAARNRSCHPPSPYPLPDGGGFTPRRLAERACYFSANGSRNEPATLRAAAQGLCLLLYAPSPCPFLNRRERRKRRAELPPFVGFAAFCLPVVTNP